MVARSLHILRTHRGRARRSGRRWIGDGAVIAEARPNRWLELKGVREHNLKNVIVRIPLKRLVCVTGVSGSGKSTLIQNVVAPLLHERPKASRPKRRALSAPWEAMGSSRLQYSSIRPRSGALRVPILRATSARFDSIRHIFSGRPALSPGSASTPPAPSASIPATGRCPNLLRQWIRRARRRCSSCPMWPCAARTAVAADAATRTSEITMIEHWPRRHAAELNTRLLQVLELTHNEALAFLRRRDAHERPLEPLSQVGLEYLKLSQPVPTLSGGEAQRLKLGAISPRSTTDRRARRFPASCSSSTSSHHRACISTMWRSCCAPSGRP